jgi:hypothetical protein
MSVFKYADNTEPEPQNYDDLEEQLNEGEEDEGKAPLGAEFPTEEDLVEEEDDSDSEEDEEEPFSLFKKDKGVK